MSQEISANRYLEMMREARDKRLYWEKKNRENLKYQRELRSRPGTTEVIRTNYGVLQAQNRGLVTDGQKQFERTTEQGIATYVLNKRKEVYQLKRIKWK